jgi:hypothetical protein
LGLSAGSDETPCGWKCRAAQTAANTTAIHWLCRGDFYVAISDLNNGRTRKKKRGEKISPRSINSQVV